MIFFLFFFISFLSIFCSLWCFYFILFYFIYSFYITNSFSYLFYSFSGCCMMYFLWYSCSTPIMFYDLFLRCSCSICVMFYDVFYDVQVLYICGVLRYIFWCSDSIHVMFWLLDCMANVIAGPRSPSGEPFALDGLVSLFSFFGPLQPTTRTTKNLAH
jgi:hypothetical protein